MPVYDFKCSMCGAIHEISRKIDDTSDRFCDFCGSILVKKYSPVAVSFKGGGFYRTDNRK